MAGYCDCHKKIESKIADLAKFDDTHAESHDLAHKDIWIDVKKKVSMNLFLFAFTILIGFMGTIAATQIKIIYSISEIDKTVAVLSYQLNKK